jgi:CRISPR/Cas system-associated exonuclease Cas4 (RecB family)
MGGVNWNDKKHFVELQTEKRLREYIEQLHDYIREIIAGNKVTIEQRKRGRKLIGDDA